MASAMQTRQHLPCMSHCRLQDVRATEIDKVRGVPACMRQLAKWHCMANHMQPCSLSAVHIAVSCILQVVMYDCFRPGDVVRCEVLSLGDARSYYLTTAKNELGVVYAKSVAGGREGQRYPA